MVYHENVNSHALLNFGTLQNWFQFFQYINTQTPLNDCHRLPVSQTHTLKFNLNFSRILIHLSKFFRKKKGFTWSAYLILKNFICKDFLKIKKKTVGEKILRQKENPNKRRYKGYLI